MIERDPTPQELNGMRHLDDITWDEVKQSWKDDEDSPSFRREYAQHGHETWESWRKIIFDALQLDTLTWKKYKISNPIGTVPHFRGGPFTPWQKLYYGDKYLPTFEEIVAIEESDVTTRDKFANIIPSTTPIQLVGLQKAGDIYIVEGMHRSTAIALAASRGQQIDAPVTLLLAETDMHEFEMID